MTFLLLCQKITLYFYRVFSSTFKLIQRSFIIFSLDILSTIWNGFVFILITWLFCTRMHVPYTFAGILADSINLPHNSIKSERLFLLSLHVLKKMQNWCEINVYITTLSLLCASSLHVWAFSTCKIDCIYTWHYDGRRPMH